MGSYFDPEVLAAMQAAAGNPLMQAAGAAGIQAIEAPPPDASTPERRPDQPVGGEQSGPPQLPPEYYPQQAPQEPPGQPTVVNLPGVSYRPDIDVRALQSAAQAGHPGARQALDALVANGIQSLYPGLYQGGYAGASPADPKLMHLQAQTVALNQQRAKKGLPPLPLPMGVAPPPSPWTNQDEKYLTTLESARANLQGLVDNGTYRPEWAASEFADMDRLLAGLRQRQQQAQGVALQQQFQQRQVAAQLAQAGVFQRQDPTTGEVREYQVEQTAHGARIVPLDRTGKGGTGQRGDAQARAQNQAAQLALRAQQAQAQQASRLRTDFARRRDAAYRRLTFKGDDGVLHRPTPAEVESEMKAEEDHYSRLQGNQGLPGQRYADVPTNWILQAARSAQRAGDMDALDDLRVLESISAMPEDRQSQSDKELYKTALSRVQDHIPPDLWAPSDQPAPQVPGKLASDPDIAALAGVAAQRQQAQQQRADQLVGPGGSVHIGSGVLPPLNSPLGAAAPRLKVPQVRPSAPGFFRPLRAVQDVARQLNPLEAFRQEEEQRQRDQEERERHFRASMRSLERSKEEQK
jgi:hypothetical protein